MILTWEGQNQEHARTDSTSRSYLLENMILVPFSETWTSFMNKNQIKSIYELGEMKTGFSVSRQREREREETRSVVQCWREEEWAEALSLRISIGFGSSSAPVFWILIWFYICLVRIWLIIYTFIWNVIKYSVGKWIWWFKLLGFKYYFRILI